jgi:hypothetical protein
MRFCYRPAILLCGLIATYATVSHATDISGSTGTATWTAAGNPYRIVGPMVVGTNDTLNIAPGVRLESGGGSFTVNGMLRARGTEADSIIFDGVRIVIEDAAPSELRYVRVSGVEHIDRNDRTGGGVRVTRSVALFEHSVIRDNRLDVGTESGYGGGIGIEYGSAVVMRHCTVKRNLVTGASWDSESLDSRYLGHGGGLSAYYLSSVLLLDCMVSGNTSLGENGGGIFTFMSAFSAIHSVVSENLLWNQGGRYSSHVRPYMQVEWYGGHGAAIKEVNSRVLFTNCIIVDNVVKPSGSFISGAGRVGFQSCIIWGNVGDMEYIDAEYSAIQLESSSEYVGGNIGLDPEFINHHMGDYSLQTSSPCIDTGDPRLPRDSDGSRVDMGIASYLLTRPVIAIVRKPSPGTDISLPVANFGTEDLIVYRIDLTPAFSTTTVFPITIASDSSTVIRLTYNGSALDADVATIQHSDTTTGPVEVRITGVSATSVGSNNPLPRFHLSQNAPNPFNPTTTLRFTLETGGDAVLAIYDVTGRHVRTLVSGPMDAGAHQVVWDGTDDAGRAVASGVYMCQLRWTAHDGNSVHSESRKMLLLR